MKAFKEWLWVKHGNVIAYLVHTAIYYLRDPSTGTYYKQLIVFLLVWLGSEEGQIKWDGICMENIGMLYTTDQMNLYPVTCSTKANFFLMRFNWDKVTAAPPLCAYAFIWI